MQKRLLLCACSILLITACSNSLVAKEGKPAGNNDMKTEEFLYERYDVADH